MPTGCRSVYLSEVSVNASAPWGRSSTPAGDLECGAKDLGTHELCHFGESLRLSSKRWEREEEMEEQQDLAGKRRTMEVVQAVEAALVRIRRVNLVLVPFGVCSKVAALNLLWGWRPR